ncbi:hypothetical protein ES703_81629 [subsurface metagenome]
MEAEIMKLAVELDQVELLKRLVDAEIERRCQAIEDIVAAGYGDYIGKRAESNAEAVKSAILVLVHSDLAALERMLACVEVKPEEEPVEEVKPEEEAPPAEEPEPGKKPGKSKA